MVRCTVSSRRYIGSSCNFTARKRRHLHQLRHGSHHSRFMQREFNKHGESAFVFEVIESGIPASALIERETAAILSMLPEYNGAQPGATRIGSKQTDSCKAKVSAANKGRTRTAETKARIGAASKGNQYAKGNTNRLKVTASIREEILALRESGIGCRRLAVMFGVDKKTIHNVYHRNYKSEI